MDRPYQPDLYFPSRFSSYTMQIQTPPMPECPHLPPSPGGMSLDSFMAPPVHSPSEYFNFTKAAKDQQQGPLDFRNTGSSSSSLLASYFPPVSSSTLPNNQTNTTRRPSTSSLLSVADSLSYGSPSATSTSLGSPTTSATSASNLWESSSYGSDSRTALANAGIAMANTDVNSSMEELHSQQQCYKEHLNQEDLLSLSPVQTKSCFEAVYRARRQSQQGPLQFPMYADPGGLVASTGYEVEGSTSLTASASGYSSENGMEASRKQETSGDHSDSMDQDFQPFNQHLTDICSFSHHPTTEGADQVTQLDPPRQTRASAQTIKLAKLTIPIRPSVRHSTIPTSSITSSAAHSQADSSQLRSKVQIRPSAAPPPAVPTESHGDIGNKHKISVPELPEIPSALHYKANNVKSKQLGTFPAEEAFATSLDQLINPTSNDKPNYLWWTLIRAAILGSEDQKLQMDRLCTDIQDKFPYFRNAKEAKNWKSSIRSVIHTKPCFYKTEDAAKNVWWHVDVNIDPREQRRGLKKRNSIVAAETPRPDLGALVMQQRSDVHHGKDDDDSGRDGDAQSQKNIILETEETDVDEDYVRNSTTSRSKRTSRTLTARYQQGGDHGDTSETASEITPRKRRKTA